MTLESDAKFEEKLTLGFKNDMTNLVNFNASSGKSENLHFYVLLLSIAYKVSAKKVQKNYLSRHRRVIQTMNKNSLFLKNGMTNLMNFNLSSENSENVHFDGIFLSKVCNVWVKINRRIVSWTMTHGFKNEKEFGEFLHKQLKVLLDKSSVFNAPHYTFW